MKNLLIFLLAVSMFCACNQGQNDTGDATNETTEIADENVLKMRFEISGMTCTGCEKTIAKSVKELPGIVEVEASHKDSVAYVKFDKSQTTIEDITASINEKGYQVDGYEMMME